MHDVDVELGICTCFIGKNGAPCKHQAAVVDKFGLNSFNFVPLEMNTKMRNMYVEMATGIKNH